MVTAVSRYSHFGCYSLREVFSIMGCKSHSRSSPLSMPLRSRMFFSPLVPCITLHSTSRLRICIKVVVLSSRDWKLPLQFSQLLVVLLVILSDWTVPMRPWLAVLSSCSCSHPFPWIRTSHARSHPELHAKPLSWAVRSSAAPPSSGWQAPSQQKKRRKSSRWAQDTQESTLSHLILGR